MTRMGLPPEVRSNTPPPPGLPAMDLTWVLWLLDSYASSPTPR